MNLSRYKAAVLRLAHSALKTGTTARDAAGNDIYIVEFPKSGITWLSTILANAAFLHSNSKMRATYYNISSFIPDVHVSGRSVGEGLRPHLGVRLIKSHDNLNLNYRNVIYLCRNPYSVMNSYIRFKRQAADPSLTVAGLLKAGGVLDQWKGHVNGWLTHADQRRRFTLIRYEDIVADPGLAVAGLLRVLGIELSGEMLSEVITRSDIKAMRDDENDYRKRNPRYSLELVKSDIQTPLADFREEVLFRTREERQLLGYQD